MLRRTSHQMARAGPSSLSAGAGAGRLRLASPTDLQIVALPTAHSPIPAERSSRRLHFSAVCRKRDKLTVAEQNVMREIVDLKQLVDIQDKVIGSAENEKQLEAPSEETLSLLYEALKIPDPPTSEEMRLEELRRLRLALSRNSGNDEAQQALLQLQNTHHRLLEARSAREKAGQDMSNNIVAKIATNIDKSELIHTQRDPSPSMDITPTNKDISPGDLPDAILLEVDSALQSLKIDAESTPGLPVALIDGEDWYALAKFYARMSDFEGIVKVLKLMKRCGAVDGEASLRTKVANSVMNIFAERGNVTSCQTLTAILNEIEVTTDSSTTHYTIKAMVYAKNLDGAVNMLSTLEQSRPARIDTYALVMRALLRETRTPSLQSKIWPLFSQMRFAAHPQPDAPTYALIIRACALGIPQPEDKHFKPSMISPDTQIKAYTIRKKAAPMHVPRRCAPDTERALDLFREMTIRYDIRPTPEVYANVILACAKDKDPNYYNKGIEILQRMIEIERQRLTIEDPSSLPSHAPDRHTYNALLQGCARHGDLLRARWILAEMLRSSMALWSSIKEQGQAIASWQIAEVEQRRPNAETMAHVFSTYAKYKPPVSPKRAALSAKNHITSSQPNTHQTSSGKGEDKSLVADIEDDRTDDFKFGESMPTSPAMVLREATGLLERMASDRGSEGKLFSNIRPEATMLNGYLKVLNRHAEKRERTAMMRQAVLGHGDDAPAVLDVAFEGRSIFAEFDVQPNAWTCLIALRTCKDDVKRQHSLALAVDIFNFFRERSLPKQGSGTEARRVLDDESWAKTNPAIISEIWAVYMQILANANRCRGAMQLLREFTEAYPPPNEGETQRLRESMAPERQRPMLLFGQLQSLYMRINTFVPRTKAELDERQSDLDFIKWASTAYQHVFIRPKPEALQVEQD